MDMKNFKNINKAFTFVELSVVILIIAILMFGTFSSSGVVNNVRESITKDRMNVIYKALGDFLLKEKRLPCPASILTSKGSVSYGKEVRSGNFCVQLGDYSKGIYLSNIAGQSEYDKLVFGMVPTNSLGLANDFAEDAFGNKISYYIDEDFTYNYISQPDINLAIPSFGTADYKNVIFIKERTNSGETFINNDAIIVLVSAGVNGFGAFNNKGIQNIRSNNSEELANDFYNLNLPESQHFDKIFYSNYEDSESFDDIVFFKTRNDFVNDFSAMTLIPCKGNDILDKSFDKKSIYYGTQDLIAVSGCPIPNESIKKTIKCDVFGNWTGLVVNCPGTTVGKCSIPAGNGIAQVKIVNANTSKNNEICDQQYYSGTYSWGCNYNPDNSTNLTLTNSCIAYCSFSLNGETIRIAPGGDQARDCGSNQQGYITFSCSLNGISSTNNQCY